MDALPTLSLNLVWIFLSLVLASYVQNLTGFAFGLIFLGLVSSFQLMPMGEAANAITLISLLQAGVYFREFPLSREWKVVRPALLPSLIGVAIGVVLLSWLSGYALRALRIALGIAIILSALSLVIKVKTRDQLDPPYVFALTGLVSGLMGGMFSTAGPPLVFHMYRQPLRPEVIRECLLMIFATGQVVRLLIILVTGQFTPGSIFYAVVAIPLVFLVTKGNRRFPLKLSAAIRSRIAGLLLLMVGLGLVLT